MKSFEITAITTTKGDYLRKGLSKEGVLEDLFHELQVRHTCDEVWDFDMDTFFIQELSS